MFKEADENEKSGVVPKLQATKENKKKVNNSFLSTARRQRRSAYLTQQAKE